MPDGAQVSRWVCGCVAQTSLKWPGGAEVFSGQVALRCSVTVLVSDFLGGAGMLPFTV